MPINSAIAAVSASTEGALRAKGYALGDISKVLLSIDKGKTWQSAQIVYQGGKWGWTLWQGEVPNVHRGPVEVWSMAFGGNGEKQPIQSEWTWRGVCYNGVGVAKA